ncbi:uncharacterized protein MKK02DRAFT_40073 [Dioszegia hungarica]|uniref:SRPBCC domain-containing protein n=1 Tax=Dioszegia hungarica TaxID=4972 RepID=A0AA38LZ57_9TREE|nr:uncharacterized protein MKK02DRAFT_40073 [Dioszegia hungarica]KAI9639749.1 hypothetical protein MKK02DRAFT_40073 [Dioszegia hungarica]
MIKAEIAINAPPRIVREILLDFPNLATWHDKSFFTDIKVISPADKTTGLDLKVGDTVRVGFVGASFKGVIAENDPHLFSWIASLPFIFTGQHYFHFTPDATDANKTLFVQTETFTGLLDFTSAFFGAKTVANWKRVNEELKVAAESSWAKQQGQA